MKRSRVQVSVAAQEKGIVQHVRFPFCFCPSGCGGRWSEARAGRFVLRGALLLSFEDVAVGRRAGLCASGGLSLFLGANFGWRNGGAGGLVVRSCCRVLIAGVLRGGLQGVIVNWRQRGFRVDDVAGRWLGVWRARVVRNCLVGRRRREKQKADRSCRSIRLGSSSRT